MLFNWFNAREATEVGNSLADQFLQQKSARSAKRKTKVRTREQIEELEKFNQRIDTKPRLCS